MSGLFFDTSLNANWDDIVAYMKGKYKVEVMGDKLRLGFGFEDGRGQLVLMSHEDKGDKTFAIILSKVGKISAERLPEALTHMARLIYGSLVRMGDEFFVKTCVDTSFMPLEKMDELVGFTAGQADELEREFCGGDNH